MAAGAGGLLLLLACCSGAAAAGKLCVQPRPRSVVAPAAPDDMVSWWPHGHKGLFLVFDPAVSPDYEVLLLPVPLRESVGDGGGLLLEWTLTHNMDLAAHA